MLWKTTQNQNINKSLVSFFVITFLFSWISWLPIIICGFSTIYSPIGAPLFMLGGFGPSIIGAIFIVISTDNDERINLWRRILDHRRIDCPWLLVSMLIYPFIFLISILVILPFGGTWPVAKTLTDMMMGVEPFLLNTIIILLLGPISEEVGWRGYALEKLQRLWSPIKATLLIGVIWWAWHIPLFFMPRTLHGSQGLFSFFTVGYFLTVISYSILFTWLYNNTRQSILIVILAHFSINFTIGTLSPFDGSLFVITTILLLILGFTLWLRDKQLGYGSQGSKMVASG